MVKKIFIFTVLLSFFLTSLGPIPHAHADSVLDLPAPGKMVNLSSSYEPVIIRGLSVHKDNPFLFDFIVDVGQDHMSGEPLKKEGEKLIKYFLASLAIPEKDFWVNLSPYENQRIVPEALGQTDMGRDLLEQDYILKQITASLIYPEKQLGRTFWEDVYAKARLLYGTTDIPVNTFNKVWIMADRAQVFEHGQTAFVTDQHLKVMLEEDYLALQKHMPTRGHVPEGDVSPSRQPSDTGLNVKAPQGNNNTHNVASNIIRQIVLPELEHEVNTGKNFANLRQIFNSIILSSWYKRNLKQALLNQVYSDRSKIKGIDLNDPTIKERIYQQYLKAYKKGVFNYIKEDINAAGQSMPRKYFSGGIVEGAASDEAMSIITNDRAGVAAMREEIAQHPLNGIVDIQSQFSNAAMVTDVSGHRNLIKRLESIAKDIVAPSQKLYDDLRAGLLSDFSEEISVNDFVERHIKPLIAKAEEENRMRLLFAFSGTFASGKSTVGEMVKEYLMDDSITWAEKIVSFDDFLREKEDRYPVNTENPYEKFDVERFINFIELLAQNKRATKPIYDQTSKGQLKFGLNEEGKLTIFSGNQELMIDFSEKNVTFEKFSVNRDKNGKRVERIKSLQRETIQGLKMENVTLGSLPINILRFKNGNGVTVYIKDSKFDIVKLNGQLILKVKGENDTALSQDKKIEALEVFEPVVDPKQRQIILIEGLLVLSAVEQYDLSANVNASSFIRRVRSTIREWERGRQGASIDALHSETLTVREFTEDNPITKLNAIAIKKRGYKAPGGQTHFQINNMTLSEQLFRDYYYGYITLRHKRLFTEAGLSLDEIIDDMRQAEEAAIRDWLHDVISNAKEPFHSPGAFPGEKKMSSSEEWEAYWNDKYRTLALGRYLMMRFKLVTSKIGDIDSVTKNNLISILERTQGLLVGARILDLENDNMPIKFINSKGVVSHYPVLLKNILLMNQLPLMGSELGKIADRYDLSADPKKQEQEIAQGRRWIDEFFRLQSDLSKVGIIDAAPSLGRHYGLGFYHGKETVLGVSPTSYKLDEEALEAVDGIGALENRSLKRVNGFMNSLVSKYKDIKGIGSLSGFQLRFLGNSEKQEDYLEAIPPILRQYYVDNLRKFPKDSDDFNLITSAFGRRWSVAVQERRSGTFMNEGVASIPVDYLRLERVSAVIGMHALEELKSDFRKLMHSRTSKDKRGTTPQLQWVFAFVVSLQEDPFNFLHSMAATFKSMLLRNTNYLVGKNEGDIDQIHEDILENLKRDRNDKLPIESVWQKQVLKEVIRYAIEIGSSWSDFDKAMIVVPKQSYVKITGLQTKKSADHQFESYALYDRSAAQIGSLEINWIKDSKTYDIKLVRGNMVYYAQLNSNIIPSWADAINAVNEKYSSSKTVRPVALRLGDRQRVEGGIDLNTSSGMDWRVSKEGGGVQMDINPAMIARFSREGIDHLSPVILKITPVSSIWPLVGRGLN